MTVYGGPDIITDGLVLNIDAGNIKSFDPVNPNVELLLHMDGANNSTTFTDSSKNGTTVTRYGNAKVSTDQSKFGGSSAYFDGNGDFLQIADNNAFEIGGGDFTFEAWIYLTGYSPSYNGYYIASIINKDTNNARSYVFQISGTSSSWTTLGVALFSSNISYVSTQASHTFALNTWYHVAASRNGTSLRLYVNGIDIGGGTNSTIAQNTSATIEIGSESPYFASQGYGYYFPGYMDELRIVKGKALYTSNFTPERKPYLDGNKIYDLSGNENNGTLVNGPTYSSDNYGVMSFDGTDDKIEIPSNSIFNFSSNFAINFAFKLNSINNNYTQIGPNINTSGGFSFYYVGPGNYYNIGVNSFVISNRISNFLVRGFAVETNKWYFITITRSGTSLQMYINGEQLGSTVSNSTNFTQGVLQLGGDSDSSTHTMNGYISNLCIYKNTTFEIQHVKQNYNALKGRYGL